jgi:2-polyprenyl-3-methyl-5-hydroxy-6-metoxy-1,4-benzoquinol methylase
MQVTMVIANLSFQDARRRDSLQDAPQRDAKVQDTKVQERGAASGTILDLLQCPACGGNLSAGHDAVVCHACGAVVAVRDGVLDFVAGTAATQLDDIDYDQFYAIDENHAAMTYDDIRTAAGALWPASFGEALEIGCGTGGFSMAVAAKVPVARFLLTDVSRKMLALCRRRLEQLPAVSARSIDYATYSGREPCFRPNAFDTCFGTAVVHHVLDVQTFLRQVHDLLKPGGVAFFMEPNLQFHQALTGTLARLVASWLREGVVPAADMSLMQNWMAEVHCNIVNTGDLEVLGDREDKHLFTAEGFGALAFDAGFGKAAALACHPDPTGLRTIDNYLHQAGVSAATLARLRQAWPDAQRNFFERLVPRDTAPSYVFWLQKVASKRRRGTLRSVAAQTEGAVSARLWVTLELTYHDGQPELVVEGWCLSPVPVKSIQIEIGAWRRRVPIWRPRPDVETLVNTDGVCPPLHALCSGIDARLAVDGVPDVATARISILAVNGAIMERGQVTLERGGASQLVT